jgi:hypothetical protein
MSQMIQASLQKDVIDALVPHIGGCPVISAPINKNTKTDSLSCITAIITLKH